MVRISRGMTEKEWKMFNYERKKEKILNDNRFYCKCGHSLNIMPTRQSKLCTNCGYLVFRDRTLQEIYDKDIQKREKKMKFMKELGKHL